MPFFKPGATIVTKEPVVIVDAGLEPGKRRFQLVVVNERGVESLPVELVVEITLLAPNTRQPRRRRSQPGG